MSVALPRLCPDGKIVRIDQLFRKDFRRSFDAEYGEPLRHGDEIDIHTFMGGIELIVPKEINIVVKSRNFIGGVSNHAGMSVKNGAPSLHVIASNFFGGVSIRDKD